MKEWSLEMKASVESFNQSCKFQTDKAIKAQKEELHLEDVKKLNTYRVKESFDKAIAQAW